MARQGTGAESSGQSSRKKKERVNGSKRTSNAREDARGLDAPNIEELRRRKVDPYKKTPESSPGTRVKSSGKTKARKTRRGENAVDDDRVNSERDADHVNEYVYSDSRPRAFHQRPESSLPTRYTSRRDIGDNEFRSHSSEESLPLLDIPPAAPDPPAPATSKISSSKTSKPKKNRTRGKSPTVSRRSSMNSKRSPTSKVPRRASEPTLPAVPEDPGSMTERPNNKRRSSLLGGLFASKNKHSRSDSVKVECLTCASSKSRGRVAILDCGHAMCHSCLRHIFTLSVTDPQHMPPRCCTSQHIPLKHVKVLFDNRFKTQWNQKYLEYTTKNRLYCPAKGCGTWIPPRDIRKSTVDPKRLLGTCSSCKTRTCGACGRKWHKNPSCISAVRDQDNKDFVEMAKASGWKKCYNCKATVELTEGCNHMTCRCGAQFCMVCGTPWKGCDCPWFNTQNVLDPQDMLFPARVYYHNGSGLRQPLGYAQELAQRQDQERRDEQMARRIQGLEIDDWEGPDDWNARRRPQTPEMERNWGGNDTYGFGNMAGHFLNDNFVLRATAILTQAMNDGTREAADRLAAEIRADRAPPIPGAVDTGPLADNFRAPPGQDLGVVDVETDAADQTRQSRRRRSSGRRRASANEVLDNAGIPTATPRSRRRTYVPSSGSDGRRSSILAGLSTEHGEDRVEQWRQHVDGGTE